MLKDMLLVNFICQPNKLSEMGYAKMRLWHQDLITKLPSKKDYKGCTNQLGGQHVEIRMILGCINRLGFVNHSTVNYVNKYSTDHLYAYGLLVIDEMLKRRFNVSENIISQYETESAMFLYRSAKLGKMIFAEHNDAYKSECVNNLLLKGISIGE